MRIHLLFTLILAAGLCSCSKNAEQDALSQAQNCLDQVSESQPQTASQCMSYIQDYNDQQASILKCSILETSGGLIESKIVSAYNQLESTSQQAPTAAFLTTLSLNIPDVTSGYATAKAADVYCQASGVVGLQWVSGVIVAGSFMMSEYSALTGGATFDPTNSAQVATALQNLVSSCTGVSTPNCDPSTLGTEVTNLSTVYCASANADTSVCTQVASATQAAGSDPTKVGQAFLCYLNSKTYNAVTSSCQ